MKVSKGNIAFFTLLLFFLTAAVIGYYSEYQNIYSLSLNGRIKSIQFDIKKDMSVKISDKVYPIGHYWPELQKHVEIGDSVYKKPKEYNILLIKAKSNERIICAYK